MKWFVAFLGLCYIASVCDCQGSSTGLLGDEINSTLDYNSEKILSNVTEKPEATNVNPNTQDTKIPPGVSDAVAVSRIPLNTEAPPQESNETVSATKAAMTSSATPSSTAAPVNAVTGLPNKIAAANTTIAANSTVSPNTTTTISPNSTVSPNTTTTIPANTTVSPNTTTTSTTTPAPTPKPKEPEYQKYVVKEGNKTCIIAKMATEIVLVSETEKRTLVLPGYRNETDLNGNCTAETQVLAFEWNEQNFTNNITFTFAKNATKFYIKNVIIAIGLINASDLVLKSEEPLFETPLNNSYRCMHEQSFNLTGSEDVNGTLKLSQVQLEAFHSDGSSDKFSSAIDCEPGDVSDIVPIAVGCALAGLVVIVLIAYLIGRRRSRTRGYLSM